MITRPRTNLLPIWSCAAACSFLLGCSDGDSASVPTNEIEPEDAAVDSAAQDIGPTLDSRVDSNTTVDKPSDGSLPDSTSQDAPIDVSSNDVAPADAGPDVPNYTPSHANPGWIGGACSAASHCDIPDAMCLTNGFANGMCSAPCDGACPDRFESLDTLSFCTDGRPFGYDQGICVARCDSTLFPVTGCPEGYECVTRNRYGDPRVLVDVCIPLAPPNSCPSGNDEVIEIDYPDRGVLWIPKEAQCAGSFDLVVMLHGINPNSVETPSLGGGRHLEILVRSLIDRGKVAPLILAEPVHFQGSSTYLYGSEWDPSYHLQLLQAQLAPRSITIKSLSYTGHSGAGCDPNNGLYKVLANLSDLIPTFAPTMKLWGLEDVCYEGSYHWTDPLGVLPNTGIALINMFSVQGDPSDFEDAVFPNPQDMNCSSTLYNSCIRHTAQPWCSYRTSSAAGISHDNNPYFFVREAFPQVFDPQGAHPCEAPLFR